MQLDHWPHWGRNMVDNVGNAPTPPLGANKKTGQQPQPMEEEQLFHLADQHRVSLDQVTANQNTTNQMWDWVAQLRASQ